MNTNRQIPKRRKALKGGWEEDENVEGKKTAKDRVWQNYARN